VSASLFVFMSDQIRNNRNNRATKAFTCRGGCVRGTLGLERGYGAALTSAWSRADPAAASTAMTAAWSPRAAACRALAPLT
jgi:hypothetical protein